MKIYVASSWRNGRQPEVVKLLESAAHEVYDFRNPSMGPGLRGVGFSWSSVDLDWRRWTMTQFCRGLDHPAARDGFEADLTGMEWADAFVLVNPCGRSAHLELGWAIGRGKPALILLADGDEPELMYRLATRLCPTPTDLLRALDDIEAERGLDR